MVDYKRYIAAGVIIWLTACSADDISKGSVVKQSSKCIPNYRIAGDRFVYEAVVDNQAVGSLTFEYIDNSPVAFTAARSDSDDVYTVNYVRQNGCGEPVLGDTFPWYVGMFLFLQPEEIVIGERMEFVASPLPVPTAETETDQLMSPNYVDYGGAFYRFEKEASAKTIDGLYYESTITTGYTFNPYSSFLIGYEIVQGGNVVYSIILSELTIGAEP